jgi:plastocyanin
MNTPRFGTMIGFALLAALISGLAIGASAAYSARPAGMMLASTPSPAAYLPLNLNASIPNPGTTTPTPTATSMPTANATVTNTATPTQTTPPTLTPVPTPTAVEGLGKVIIVDFAFTPAVLTIHVGQIVEWENRGEFFHTTTSDTGVWDSGSLSFGQKFQFQFDTPGSYPYHCTLHPSMTGTIIVVP